MGKMYSERQSPIGAMCAYARDELGFDQVVDQRASDFADRPSPTNRQSAV